VSPGVVVACSDIARNRRSACLILFITSTPPAVWAIKNPAGLTPAGPGVAASPETSTNGYASGRCDPKEAPTMYWTPSPVHAMFRLTGGRSPMRRQKACPKGPQTRPRPTLAKDRRRQRPLRICCYSYWIISALLL
jgi:hypothetical protein